MSNVSELNRELDYVEALRWPAVTATQATAAAMILTRPAKEQLSSQYRLEEEFAAWIGSRYCLSFVNGTAALYAAAYALQLPSFSEVLVPSLTFWASVLPFCWNRQVPVFCDVDPLTLCIAHDEIERKITERTRAILVVHLFGQVANMDLIERIAHRHSLVIVEDGSQALGSQHHRRNIGTIGRVGCFSLQATKYLAAGEGGLLVTQDREIFNRALCVGHYTRIVESADEELAPIAKTGLGFKFRIHPVASELARQALPNLGSLLTRITEQTRLVSTALAHYPCFDVPEVVPSAQRSYWTRLHVKYFPQSCRGLSRRELIDELSRSDVLVFDRVTPYGQGLHKEPIFQSAQYMPANWYGDRLDIRLHILQQSGTLPVTEALEESNIITFPIFPNANQEFIFAYIDRINQSMKRILQNGP